MKNSAFNTFTMKEFFIHIHSTQRANLTLALAADFAASHLLEHNNGGLLAALKYAWRNNRTNSAKLEKFFELNAIEWEECQFNTGIKDAYKRDIIAPFKPKNVQQALYFITFEQAEDIAKKERKEKRIAEAAAKKAHEAELLAKASAEADEAAEVDEVKKGYKMPMVRVREAMLEIEKASALMTMKGKKELAADLLRLVARLGDSKDAVSLSLTSTLEGEKIAINH